ncbi:protein HEG [Huso huso]|uniref:Protein HEG n=1 Tax=Huso huso TaxID=61971 RepID=A0ABR0YKE5_HUSHU
MNYTCQCIPGYYYESSNGCVQAKTFPGELHLKSINFTESMSDKSSKEFQIISSQIEAELNSILKNEKGYIKSVVLKLAPGSVLARVDNFYDLNSNVTAETISNAIRKQTETCDDTNTCKLIDKETTYSNENLCAQHNSCDLSTTTCSYTIGILSCPCKNGYLPSSFSPHVCVACASGYKVENNKCVVCPFGRAGFNCDDSSLLAVVVISCVLGGLLCIVILALLILCCSLKRSSSYSSPYPPEDFLMWPKQEVPKIPRATTNCEATQLEMTENGSTHNLVAYDNIDELKTFRGKNQSRYSYLCHGQENPYFVPDEDKRT